MPVRRSADPYWVHRVWDGIRSANAQRQMADMARIVKYIQRMDQCTQEEGELYVKQTLDDGLIVEIQKITAKGSKAGAQVESYKIPMQETPNPTSDGKDWYCIDCHSAGNVVLCRNCHRVFHASCALEKKTEIRSKTPKPSLPLQSKRAGSLTSSENGSTASNNTPEEHAQFSQLADAVEKRLEKMADCDVLLQNSNSADISAASLESDKETTIPSFKSFLSEDCGVAYDDDVCSICNIDAMEPDLGLEKAEINTLLSFVYNRIKSWLPDKLTDTMSLEAKPEWLTAEEVALRAKRLFYLDMDMEIMGSKLRKKEYRRVSQFTADVMTVQHNVAIYHGVESQEFGASEYMLKDCEHDTSELLNCVDCYRHSNEKNTDNWFCLPCRVPHKLVWAKQKGYPYWPAKVIKETDEACDVRFFGGKYERSVLPKMFIKPISTDMGSSQVKKSALLNKSLEELAVHQRLLANPLEALKYGSLKRKRKLSVKSSKSSSGRSTPKSTRKRSKSVEPDVYEFDESLKVDGGPPSGVAKVAGRRKSSASPLVKVKSTRTTEYPTRRAVQNQLNKSKAAAAVKNGATKGSATIVNDSGFDGGEKFAIRDEDYEFGQGYDGSQQEVSSSTEQIQSRCDEGYVRDNPDGLMPKTERQHSEAVEMTRRKLELCSNKSQLIQVAMVCMQEEIDAINAKHDDFTRKIFDSHNTQISETKKKQWCYYCEQDAIYHCCWNTAYCSPTCQQQHWQAEHKKVCRRKR